MQGFKQRDGCLKKYRRISTKVLMIMAIVSFMIVHMTGCSNTKDVVYENGTYGFKLVLPESMAGSREFEVIENKDKYADTMNASAIEFIMGESSQDGIYTGGTLFEVIVVDSPLPSFLSDRTLQGEKYTYHFRMMRNDTESASFNELIDKYSDEVKEIMESMELME